MFYGWKIAQTPQITLTYDEMIARKIEKKVYDQLKNIATITTSIDR